MAGTIPLSMTQQFDALGRPLSLGKLYVFQTATTTPQNAYSDTGLTAALPNPLSLDASGRVPQFFLADGTIKVRLTDKNGTIQAEYDNVLVIGPSSSAGGGATTDATTIFQTGDPIWVPVAGTRTGWVRMNARTLGNATSGASERANSDCQALYTFLYNNFSDVLLPVSGGRSGNALTDFSASKTITLPDMRGRGPFGLDDMGNAAASRLAGATFSTGNSTTAYAAGGEGSHVLASGEIPVHSHGASSSSTVNDPQHVHTFSEPSVPVLVVAGGSQAVWAASLAANTNNAATGITVDTSTGISATGGGAAHNNMPPFALGSWFIKL